MSTKTVEPFQLALNILGMYIFTFIAQPIVGVVSERVNLGIAFDDTFFTDRVETILDMTFYGILKEH